MPENNNWKPNWRNPDVPKNVEYCYPDGLFCVGVGLQGLIIVEEDAWLSKYSMAIHGDTKVLDRFYRYDNVTDRLDMIKNIDLIFKGEVLLHIPTYDNWSLCELNRRNSLNEIDSYPPFAYDTLKLSKSITEQSEVELYSISSNFSGVSGAINLPTHIEVVATLAELSGFEFVLVGSLGINLATVAGIIGAGFALPAAFLISLRDSNFPFAIAETFFAEIFAIVEYAFGYTENPKIPTYDEDINANCGVKEEDKINIPDLEFKLPIPYWAQECNGNKKAEDCIANPASWRKMYSGLNIEAFQVDKLKAIWKSTFTETVKNLNGKIPTGRNAENLKTELRTIKIKNLVGEIVKHTLDIDIDNNKKYLFAYIYIVRLQALKKAAMGMDAIYVKNIEFDIYDLYRGAYHEL